MLVVPGSTSTATARACGCTCTLPPTAVVACAEADGAQASTSTARCVAPYADCRRIVPSEATGTTYVEATERLA